MGRGSFFIGKSTVSSRNNDPPQLGSVCALKSVTILVSFKD